MAYNWQREPYPWESYPKAFLVISFIVLAVVIVVWKMIG